MNLFKTRVVVIKNTQTGEYLADFKTPMIHYPIPEMTWGTLNDAMLFTSGTEVRAYAKDHPAIMDAVHSGSMKFLSVPVELHIDKVVNISDRH